MNKNFIYLLFVLLLSFHISCKDDIVRHMGSCYIHENDEIKYLKLTYSGEIDTIVLEDANPDFFKVIADDLPGNECFGGNIWGKDKLNVWYKNIKINGADPNTFEVLENAYSKDKSYVFYKNSNLIGANFIRFKVLSYFYAKDDKMIWYNGKEVFGVEDVKTFVVFDSYFSKDQNNVYINNDTILMRIPDSDPNSFHCYEKNENYQQSSLKYYLDKNKVYLIDTDKNIGEADFLYVYEAFTSSFRVLPGKNYTIDNFNVYYKNEIIQDADRTTFSAFEKDYSKDKNTVYYKNKKLMGVNPKTFIVLSEDNKGFDAKDDSNFYLRGKKVN